MQLARQVLDAADAMVVTLAVRLAVAVIESASTETASAERIDAAPPCRRGTERQG
ncbi:MAG: hypothetical protein IT379_33565 [Deltaproteobacteria bacterium]|nr:hypothetical protein [Deltaproteobacteria bacterium]